MMLKKNNTPTISSAEVFISANVIVETTLMITQPHPMLQPPRNAAAAQVGWRFPPGRINYQWWIFQHARLITGGRDVNCKDYMLRLQ